MLTGDLADSNLASEWPDMAAGIDSPADQLRELVAPFLPATVRSRIFAAIDALLEESGSGAKEIGREQIVVETLRSTYGDTRFAGEIRMMAKAALIRLGKAGESYQYAGDEFAVTRACVHAHSRRIEEETGIPARRDKSAGARAKSKAAATGRRLETIPAAAPTAGVLRNKRSRLWSFFPGI